MILFQIDQFNLRKEIKDFAWAIKEEQSKFSVNSSYIEGDHRVNRNKSNKVVLTCSGIVKSQHIIHYLRALSEADNGEAKIKCFFIEKYETLNPLYQPISSTNTATNTPYTHRVYFNYCHIDMVASNPINDCDNYYYNIQFEISLWNSNNYDITSEVNAFIVDKDKYGDIGIRYDQTYFYDNNERYDQFLAQVSSDQNSLLASRKNLETLYKNVTCCDGAYFYIFHIDRIIKPFLSDNIYKQAGTINLSIDNKKFNASGDNFFQVFLPNQANRNILRNTTKKTVTALTSKFNDKFAPNNIAGDEPYNISNLNFVTNTYTNNGIIQIFRVKYENTGTPNYYRPTPNTPLLNLFETYEQSITFSLGSLSSVKITARGQFVLENIKMLVIHTHTQKVYGYVGTVIPDFNELEFSFTTPNNFIDLEEEILVGKLTVVGNIIGSNNYLQLPPKYQSNFYNRVNTDTITLSTDGVTDVQLNTAICMQYLAYPENKLI
jgi:hypothetical protein